MKKSKVSLLGFLILGSAAILLTAPFLGGEPISLREVWHPGSVDAQIVFDLRIPRLILALVVGGALAILGGTFQILFHNPLAEPYILGVSSAVTLGAAVSELIFHFAPFSYWGSVAGGVGALVLTSMMVWLFRGSNQHGMTRIVLFGMGVNFVLSSLLFLLLTYESQTVGGTTWRWLMGQVPWVTGHECVVFVLASLPFFGALFILGRSLDALSLGDEVARTLGFSPSRARTSLLFISSALLSLIVSFTGAIGFVGLVVPHVVRLLFRPGSTRELFLYSLIVGGVFLVICDVLARSVVPPIEFPIGILTTLIGGPIFLVLLWRRG